MKTKKVQIRRSCFETNSSSTHSLLVDNCNRGYLQECNEQITLKIPYYGPCEAFVTYLDKIDLIYNIIYGLFANDTESNILTSEEIEEFNDCKTISEKHENCIVNKESFKILKQAIEKHTGHELLFDIDDTKKYYSGFYFSDDYSNFGEEILDQFATVDKMIDFIFNTKYLYVYWSD